MSTDNLSVTISVVDRASRPLRDVAWRLPSRRARLSVSIPAYLVEWVKATAKDQGITQSRVVAEAIEDVRVAELRRGIIAGLIEDRDS